MTNNTDDARARALYDHPSGTPSHAPQGGGITAAAAGAGGKASQESPAALYGDLVLRQHINRLMSDQLAHVPNADTTVEQAKEGQFWANIAQKALFPDGLVLQLAEASIQARRAASRVVVDPDAADAEFEQQRSAWNAETVERLRLTYGTRNGEELLHRTQRFVRHIPGLAERLREGGLGSRPDIVTGIAAHVHHTGWR